MDGTKITTEYPYPVIGLWWDGDLLSESYNDGKIEKSGIMKLRGFQDLLLHGKLQTVQAVTEELQCSMEI